MEKWKSGKFSNSERQFKSEKKERVGYSIEDKVEDRIKADNKFLYIVEVITEVLRSFFNIIAKGIKAFSGFSKVKKTIIIVGVIYAIGILTPTLDSGDAFQTIKQMSKIEMSKDEVKEYESACRTIITKKDAKLTSDLLDLINEKDTNDEAIIKMLKQFSASYRESIDYSKLISLLGHENEAVAKEIASVMRSNDKVENENIFLEYAKSLKGDQDKLMRAYSMYSKKLVGNKDNIYKLEVEPKSIINSYVYNNLDDKEFKKFISYNKDIDKINGGLAIIGKELIDNRDYSKFEIYKKALKIIRDLGIEIDGTKLKDIEDTINEGIVK